MNDARGAAAALAATNPDAVVIDVSAAVDAPAVVDAPAAETAVVQKLVYLRDPTAETAVGPKLIYLRDHKRAPDSHFPSTPQIHS